ncbi:hypothetical protein MLD38_008634 [Melastoma candidum]|uniref:Uncharacterized protein n=1 Tax=Melastoma candidum TaxID=119954 RepID=A0ACB9RV55_9MYRT|nr:hypothetical protein MLD38_008634 [Melastoma candidum]
MALNSPPNQLLSFSTYSSRVCPLLSGHGEAPALCRVRLPTRLLTAMARCFQKGTDKVVPAAASGEGVPSELMEDSKFVPLNAESVRYGPPVLLLVGFDVDEAAQIQQLLKDMDGEFLKLVYCTESMVTGSLWDAVSTIQPNLNSIKVAANLPRICFLSGLTGEEMMMFIDAFPETGLEPAVFAALVPNSADKPIQELIEEIMGDHEMLTGKSEPGET